MIPRQPGVSDTQVDAFPFFGGLDLVTPAMSIPSGRLIACQNYEPDINGGYRRGGAYERFDGRARPSVATYYSLACTVTGIILPGDLVSVGAASGTYVKALSGGILLANPTGTFTGSTSMTVSAVNVGTTSSDPRLSYGDLISEGAQATSDAADQIRSAIQTVPGSGAIRGVVLYNGTVYAFRDNVGATACAMYKSTASGWSAVALGRELSFRASNTVTISIAAPGVVTLAAHNLPANTAVTLTTNGALPSGLSVGVTYYVLAPVAGSFNLAATPGGAAITTSGTQSGTHSLSVANTVSVADGETVTGGTSGATATITRYCLASGAYNNAPAGTMIFASVTGTFAANETLICSGGARLFAAGADAAITLSPGGKFRFIISNFTGRSTAIRIYGCDGVNRPFEFDGTVFVPLVTGVTGSYPSYIAQNKRYLYLAYGSSVLNSSVAAPYRWQASEGASEIAVSDNVTGLVQLPGEAVGVFTRNSSLTITGSSATSWQLTTIAPDVGAVANTIQSVADTYVLDDRGMVSVSATKNYGNFEQSTVSRVIQPLINSIKGTVVDSCVVRQKNLVRIFCSDGRVISMLPGGGETPFQFGMLKLGIAPNVVWSSEDTTGAERIFVGATNGYVYELDVGQSQDGSDLTAFFRSTYASSNSPRVRKRYRKLIFDVSVTQYAEPKISVELSYGDPDITATSPLSLTAQGAGGLWDIATWSQFYWDARDVDQPELSLTGTGLNLSILFYSKTKLDAGHVIQSALVHYTPRRLQR